MPDIGIDLSYGEITAKSFPVVFNLWKEDWPEVTQGKISFHSVDELEHLG